MGLLDAGLLSAPLERDNERLEEGGVAVGGGRGGRRRGRGWRGRGEAFFSYWPFLFMPVVIGRSVFYPYNTPNK